MIEKANAANGSSWHGNQFPSRMRLRASADFDHVYRRRASVADEVLIIYIWPNTLAHSRLGMSVSKKVGNAVMRNRWKRLIRESFRQQQANLPAGYDLVVLPRRGATPTFSAVYDSLAQLAERAARKQRRRGNE